MILLKGMPRSKKENKPRSNCRCPVDDEQQGIREDDEKAAYRRTDAHSEIDGETVD